jgi:hypothetical protein
MELNLLVTIAIFLLAQTGGLIWLLATLTQGQKDHGYRIEQLESRSFAEGNRHGGSK